VWILEHRINDEFRGPPKRQIITVIWWAFKSHGNSSKFKKREILSHTCLHYSLSFNVIILASVSVVSQLLL
jgi:hypothetical protein